MSERERPPKMKEEPSGGEAWIDHYLWCEYGQKHSALCSRCADWEGCQTEAAHEYSLRKQRHRYFMALWGEQKRLLPLESMIGKEGGDETDAEDE